ncbi:MAG: 2-oxoacid:acceptor oxidoreductase family protein [Candidatus Omnitrophota bacterium]|nr:2-oxoacid:acceptor oxidoreductase family protein [Candidatus Omnitrophota bacterium]
MLEKIIIAGSGGQGIMLLGKVLAEAAMKENKFVTWLPAYGAEVRGGAAYCMVVISSKEIGSPYIDRSDALIIMNALSVEKFKQRIRRNGLLIINSSLAKQKCACPAKILRFPFTDIAVSLGNVKVANMSALGCYLSEKKTVGLKSVLEVIQEMAPSGRKGLIEVNKKALFGWGRLVRIKNG